MNVLRDAAHMRMRNYVNSQNAVDAKQFLFRLCCIWTVFVDTNFDAGKNMM